MKYWLPLPAFIAIVGVAVFLSSCAPAAAPKAPPPGASGGQAQPPSGQGAPPSGGKPSVPPASGDQRAAVDRMIVYESKVSMDVADATEAMDRVAEIATRQGGYVVSNSFRYEGDRKVATVTIRVPSRNYQDTLAELRAIAIKVENEDSKSQDVTEEYSDLGAQLRALEAAEAQYLELLRRAQSVDDILKVQGRLSETRKEIERIKGRLVYLERTTDMASITVSLFTSTKQKADPKAGLPTWWRKTTDAFEESFVFLGNAATLLGMAIGFLWWLIIPSGVAAFVFGRKGARGKAK